MCLEQRRCSGWSPSSEAPLQLVPSRKYWKALREEQTSLSLATRGAQASLQLPPGSLQLPPGRLFACRETQWRSL